MIRHFLFFTLFLLVFSGCSGQRYSFIDPVSPAYDINKLEYTSVLSKADPVLKWKPNTSYQNYSDITYDVEVLQKIDEKRMYVRAKKKNTAESSFRIPFDLQVGQTYYWRVKIHYGRENGKRYSTSWSDLYTHYSNPFASGWSSKMLRFFVTD